MSCLTLCVILHYGDEKETWTCLESLSQVEVIDVVVADNDPKQRFTIPPRFSSFCTLFRTGGGLGFAAANNAAIQTCRDARHTHFLFLNNDTIVRAGAVERLLDTFADLSVGAAGPCMPFADRPEQIWACGGFVNRVRLSVGGNKRISSSDVHDVDYLPGAAVMCSTIVWDAVSGFPEEYFLAYEEVELALRVRALGFRVVVNPHAVVLHRVGMSSQLKPMYAYNSVRNRIRFGQFLYGQSLGFFVGAINTFVDSRSPKRLLLWSIAVMHELKSVPLDGRALSMIERRHTRKRS